MISRVASAPEVDVSPSRGSSEDRGMGNVLIDCPGNDDLERASF